MLDVLDWAGFAVRLPEGIDGLCCGMAFASKGFFEAAAGRGPHGPREALWRASSEGRLTVVTDASPCAGTLAELGGRRPARGRTRGADARLPGLLGPRGPARARRHAAAPPGTAILHPTCTLVKEGGLGDLLAVARAHAERVVVPRFAECCGFAGDRGFLVPGADRERDRGGGGGDPALLSAEPRRPGCYSTCRTCEIGMSRAVGRPVQLAAAPRPRGGRACLTASSTRSPSLPRVPTYLVLMVLSALENVFPPVPADTAVALGAFLARRGEVSVVPLAALCWLANIGSAAGDVRVRPDPRPGVLPRGLGTEAHAARG